MNESKNIVLFGKEARNVLWEGKEIVYKTVSMSLGASGRNGVYNTWNGRPLITNDGVSLAREVRPDDAGHAQGADLIKQVAEKTNAEAGDGTTTSIVIASDMVDTGISILDSDSKINPMKVRKEIMAAAEEVVVELKKEAIPVTSLEDLQKVANISVENPEYGDTIAKTIFEAGDNGVVMVNESTNDGVDVTRVEGYEFNQGWLSPFMVTNPNTMASELKNCYVLCTEILLTLSPELLKIFDTLNYNAEQSQIKNSLLIVCDDIHPDVINFAGMNNIGFLKNEPKKNVWCTIVKKPMQANMIEDIAVLVGAEAMTKSRGLLKIAKEYLGKCEKIIVKKDMTTIISDESAKERIDLHVANLKSQIEDAKDNEHTQQKLRERIAKLTGGVFYINVGGRTEQDAKYNKLKVEDAVNATKAARAEGIIAGGGASLFHIGRKLFEGRVLNFGERIVVSACNAPFSQILKNSGEENSVWQSSEPRSGYNSLTNTFVHDVIEEGIIDPVKVTISALRNAATFAGLFLTIEAVIVPVEPKTSQQN